MSSARCWVRYRTLSDGRMRRDKRRCFEEQQRQFGQLLGVLATQRTTGASATNGASERENPAAGPSGLSERSTPSQETTPTRASAWSTGSAIQALASQIPEFSGKEDENVRSWTRRVEKVVQVDGVSDNMTLLAAFSKLAGSARRWFDIQAGPAVESWMGLRDDLIKMFDEEVPFFKLMQRIEKRKWLPNKETYDEYAIDKLALMHRVDLEEKDKIHLLIGDITQSSLCSIALSVNVTTVDVFMEYMRRITHGVAEQDRKLTAANATAKPKDGTCNCEKEESRPQGLQRCDNLLLL